MQDNSRQRFPLSIAIVGRKRETARQEFSVRKKILDLLREKGALTVPEIAKAMAVPLHDVQWWLMGCLRYNQVKASEKADDDGYYRYTIIEGQ